MTKSYTKLFWELLKTDLHIYKNVIWDSFINSAIWVICLLTIFGYVFPAIGMQKGFGAFIAIGAIVSCSFWDVWNTCTNFISDIEGNKTINYFLTLPIPNWLVLVKQLMGYALKSAITSLIILPIGKIILWNKMSLHLMSIPKFILVYILVNIFTGAFSLFVTSFIENLHNIAKVNLRFLFPLWFFGGSNYPWELLLTLSKPLAYVSLANPLLYAMEGIRAAVLGQEGYINYWICILMLIFFTFLFGTLGIIRLKKRLDFV